jgi:hypothetical protein
LYDPKNTSDKVVKQDILSGDSNVALATIMQTQEHMYPEQARAMLNKGISTMNSYMADPDLDPVARTKQANTLLANIAKGIPLMNQIKMGPQFSTEVKKTVDFVVPPIVENMTRMLNEANTKVPGSNLHVDTLPNGNFVIKGDNPDLVNKFNSKFSANLNNALDAFAVSSSTPKEKAAKAFYGEYFQHVLEPLNPQGGTNPSTTPAVPYVANPSASEGPSVMQATPAPAPATPYIEKALDKMEKAYKDKPESEIYKLKQEYSNMWLKAKADKNLSEQQKKDKASELWAELKRKIQEASPE